MSHIDDPGMMESILADLDAKPIEFWTSLLEKYENEKPGDIILPGVPPSRRDNAESASPVAPQKTQRKARKAA